MPEVVGRGVDRAPRLDLRGRRLARVAPGRPRAPSGTGVDRARRRRAARRPGREQRPCRGRSRRRAGRARRRRTRRRRRAAARRSRRGARPARARSCTGRRKSSSAGISRRPRVDAATAEPSVADERERELGGGVGVCDRAADGAAVARDGVADVGEHGRERGMREQSRVRLADGRADPHRAVRRSSTSSSPRRGSRRRGATGAAAACSARARGSARRRAPSPRRRPAASALERLVERLGPHVLERRGLHCWSSSHTRPGVNGGSTSSRPSASATAFAIAAGTLIVVPSPSPFAPSGRNGDGDSR